MPESFSDDQLGESPPDDSEPGGLELARARARHIVRSHWQRRAQAYDAHPHNAIHSKDQHQAWLWRLAEWIDGRPVDALDIGCGTGFLALLLAELGHTVTGLDNAPAMLERARTKAAAAGLGLEVTLRHGDAEHPPFCDATFELIAERHVLWTLTDPVTALRAWRGLLRPGGRLIVIEGNWHLQHTTAEYRSVRRWLPLYGNLPPKLLERVLEATGYRIERVEQLTDPALWGAPIGRELYAIHATGADLHAERNVSRLRRGGAR